MEAVEAKQYDKKNEEKKPRPEKKQDACAAFTEFRRPNYYFGQLLSTREFIGEQEYFRQKLMRHNRCLHGYGIVCGLEVTPVPPTQKCDPRIEDQIRALETELAGIKPDSDENRKK